MCPLTGMPDDQDRSSRQAPNGICQNLSQFFKVILAIYEDKFFVYVFAVNFEVYIKRENSMVAGAEFRTRINVTY